MFHTLPSSFLFPIIIYHIKIYQLQSTYLQKEKVNPKRGWESPLLKN